jgi:hypothetical protein
LGVVRGAKDPSPEKFTVTKPLRRSRTNRVVGPVKKKETEEKKKNKKNCILVMIMNCPV